MQPNIDNIDLIIQYALLVAGEEDEFIDRDLGPIHLLKYVYLADLYNARRNNGETFTDIDWQFFKYGPWSLTVHDRIDPALAIIGADKSEIESRYEDREYWYRWRLTSEHHLKEKERNLPAWIKLHLKQAIHKYLKDTPALLNYVYGTKPMVHAAPGEILDFSTVIEESDVASDAESSEHMLRIDTLSKKEKKRFSERLAALRDERRAQKPKERNVVTPEINPEYNEIFNQGIEWLDEIAGPAFPTDEFVAEFSDDVWKSATRKGEDVS